jgi:hypothetical protein
MRLHGNKGGSPAHRFLSGPASQDSGGTRWLPRFPYTLLASATEERPPATLQSPAFPSSFVPTLLPGTLQGRQLQTHWATTPKDGACRGRLWAANCLRPSAHTCARKDAS